MNGCTDLLFGRREEFEKCKYWIRDEESKDLSEYNYKDEPNGYFYAKEVTAEDFRKTQINGVFLFDESSTTLFTTSNVKLKKGDLVGYNGDIWIVQDAQIKKKSKNRQFMTRPGTSVYIQIKK